MAAPPHRAYRPQRHFRCAVVDAAPRARRPRRLGRPLLERFHLDGRARPLGAGRLAAAPRAIVLAGRHVVDLVVRLVLGGAAGGRIAVLAETAARSPPAPLRQAGAPRRGCLGLAGRVAGLVRAVGRAVDMAAEQAGAAVPGPPGVIGAVRGMLRLARPGERHLQERRHRPLRQCRAVLRRVARHRQQHVAARLGRGRRGCRLCRCQAEFVLHARLGLLNQLKTRHMHPCWQGRGVRQLVARALTASAALVRTRRLMSWTRTSRKSRYSRRAADDASSAGVSACEKCTRDKGHRCRPFATDACAAAAVRWMGGTYLATAAMVATLGAPPAGALQAAAALNATKGRPLLVPSALLLAVHARALAYPFSRLAVEPVRQVPVGPVAAGLVCKLEVGGIVVHEHLAGHHTHMDAVHAFSMSLKDAMPGSGRLPLRG